MSPLNLSVICHASKKIISWLRSPYGLGTPFPTNLPQLADSNKLAFRYAWGMARVFLADSQNEARSALRLFPMELKIQVVGEGVDRVTTLAQVLTTSPDT